LESKRTTNYMSYCAFCSSDKSNDLNKNYHDNFYGFPITSDREYFERLVMEINQAGLSWNTILVKQENFKIAFDDYDIEKIAKYSDEKIDALLNNKGIIRNKLKVNAVIYNAGQFLTIIDEYGSFDAWLELNNPKSLKDWVKLFKTKFKFVGGEIVREFLTSVGYIEPAHDEACIIFTTILNLKPKWNEKNYNII